MNDAPALVKRYFTAINASDPGELEDLLAPDFVQHTAGIPPGRESVKRLLAMFRAAFPDVEYRLDALHVDGTHVIARTTTRGTHAGMFMGHAPTGKRFVATGIDVFRVEQDRIAERWAEFDTFGMLQQLGLVPAPWQAGQRAR